MIPHSELLLTPDGNIYHLNLKPEQIAENIILVGDPDRVDMIAEFFDSKEFKVQNREFVTITGNYNGERITVMSTGIGVCNIDIVLNELDALANIDFKTRTIKEDKTSLNLVRIGTSGALQKEIDLGSYILSKQVLGVDGLMNFHADRDKVCDLEFEKEFLDKFPELNNKVIPYVVEGSNSLLEQLDGPEVYKGVTITAPGFYASQGRCLRIDLALPDFNDKLEKFTYNGLTISNYEMETSALYGYAKLLGHEAATICLAIANRPKKEAMSDYHPKMGNLIKYVLESFC